METYEVMTCPTTESSWTNRAILNPAATLAQFEHIAIRYPKKGPRETEAFVFSVATDLGVPNGKIAFNVSGRKWASLMIQSVIEAAPYKFITKSQCLNSITFSIDFANRSTAPKNLTFDTDDMAKSFSEQFTNQAFTVGQLFGFVYKINNIKITFELRVKQLEAIQIDQDIATQSVEIGLTTANTVVMFESARGSEILLTGGMTGTKAAPRMFNQDWDFEKMGVGGLSEQFNKIFRRAFVSRIFPPQFAQTMGFKHVKGILLYGPPGTGKTLIARQIGKMLLAREPKIVNGPEILNKYVGESEANIRKLFAEAEEEQAKLGINSGLHVIIFDEFDSLCKSRGNSASTSGVGDNVVNQLLTKIDGVDALDNVLLIGMTNRRDLIDEAILRPGRFSVQIEVGLPNRDGRLEIFKIHTKQMSDNKILDSTVDLAQLADRTKNYSGAEIADLVQAAQSRAASRVVKIGEIKDIDQKALADVRVTGSDFDYAIEQDVKPALGASEEDLKDLARPIIEWDPQIAAIQNSLNKIINSFQAPTAVNRPRFTLLLGDAKTGTTTYAANMAAKTSFPFIRVYQSSSTAGKLESVKVQYIEKLFNDASRSEQSCIVIDDLEEILDYTRHGPQFSRATRSVMAASRNLRLPEGRRMLVICTCKSEQFLRDVALEKLFHDVVKIPSITRPEQVKAVLDQLSESGDNPFDGSQCVELVEKLGKVPFKLGIKELECLAEIAKQDEPSSRVGDFIERMHSLNLFLLY